MTTTMTDTESHRFIELALDGNHGVRAYFQLVTPSIACSYLENRANNRDIKAANLRRLEADMRAQAFVFNGQPLIFDEEGRLLNGQHRLTAQVNTGTSHVYLVVRGVPRSTVGSRGTRSVGGVLAKRKNSFP